jgi:hypothetical protein
MMEQLHGASDLLLLPVLLLAVAVISVRWRASCDSPPSLLISPRES